ncbi:MAG TPA: alpha/beta fold hydrolase [Candidatus Cryosericum sp.]|nr:alpha/beta fold hydrolase [Candidatus Cryosericum sp.]
MDCVVLLHGLGRTPRSMRRLERSLRASGYDTLNVGYPSFCARVEGLARLVAERIAAGRPGGGAADGGRLHLVGHSLGGILIRWIIVHRPPPGLARVVLLAAPNQGSRLADATAPWLSWLMRPLPDLTTDETNAAHTLPTPAGVPIGVIAGSWDWTVPVERAGLRGAADFVVARSGHMFLPDVREVHELTARFLATARFRL